MQLTELDFDVERKAMIYAEVIVAMQAEVGYHNLNQALNGRAFYLGRTHLPPTPPQVEATYGN